ncbi:hypothetical protein H2201_003975 [Coniosporium apollinis]|uniref:BZIP domain-containing protein n=2 Tax=Coniosporium TaxID=2810619 RepID=A0ABQ9NTZ7_9PEZI|nr:hypothetical protein H2199_005526 [Cladosporium sp. JES 115]KAJ9665851.1 hypothetical protein H2201_003975 [Coniosporium apollinis]
MDYNYFNSPPSQPYPFNGLPPTPSYDNAPATAMDSFQAPGQSLGPFLPEPDYDALTYAFESSDFILTASGSPPIPQISYLADGLPRVDTEDSGRRRSGGRARSSSEEDREQDKSLTPAQWRRKEQNRAAQRAFRERKERHLRDLEDKLAALSSQHASLASTNSRLLAELERTRVENEILRASSSSDPHLIRPPSPTDPHTDGDGPHLKQPPEGQGQEEARYTRALAAPPVLGTSAYPSQGTQGTYLSPSAAWDLIQSHPLVRDGIVDITDVAARLQRRATCDGMGGPVFEAEAVREAVEGATRIGGNGLG